MFIVREYVACLFGGRFAAILYGAAYGVLVGLKSAGRIAARTMYSLRRVAVDEAPAAIFLVPIAIPFLIVLLGVARGNEPAAVPSGQENGYTFRVSVEQVVLHATVLNRKGVPVSGLDKVNFQIFEDGVPQGIAYFSRDDIPVTVGLIVDNSGSMRPKHPEVIAAALAFARSSNPQDQMFVVNFNEKVSFGLPENLAFTGDAAQLETALSRISADGETALYDAVAAGLEHLQKGNRDKRVLIVISDGADNASKRTKAQILTMAGRSDAVLYTIGLFDESDPDQHFDVLKQLARAAGGESFLPASAKDVIPICQRIAHDIRSQYTLAYIPTNRRRDGTYRAVQVKAGGAGRGQMSVRSRAGYYASTEPQTAVDNPSRKP